MDLPARERYIGGASVRPTTRRTASWTIFVVVLLTVAAMPSIVAATVTASPDDSRWFTRPWLGWQFAIEVISEGPSARAASPGEALELATVEFQEPTAFSVELAYVEPDGKLEFVALGPDGETTVDFDPSRPLVWQVHGSWPDSTARGTIGLLDFATGTLVWDIREDLPESRMDST